MALPDLEDDATWQRTVAGSERIIALSEKTALSPADAAGQALLAAVFLGVSAGVSRQEALAYLAAAYQTLDAAVGMAPA